MMGSARRPGRLAGLLVVSGLALLALILILDVAHAALDSQVLVYLLAFNSYLLVGGFIAARRPENAIGWLFCGMGLTTNVALLLQQYALLGAGAAPGAAWAAWVAGPIQVSAWVLLFSSLLLFPTGRPLSPRWGWFICLNALLLLAVSVLMALATPQLVPTAHNVPMDSPLYVAAVAPYVPALAALAGWISVTGLGLEAVLRFRRAEQIERLQLEWFTYTAAMWLASSVALAFAKEPLGLPQALLDGVSLLGVLALGLVVARTILRYRLYDIDLIIRRTLIYGALTALLAAVYFGGVALSQVALTPLTGGARNDLGVVASTLGIAALFQPLRRRIQRFIDHRFYRRKYDAARTLARFSAQARDEVELDALIARLVGVVQETMQPAAVSLWLRAGAAGPGAAAAPGGGSAGGAAAGFPRGKWGAPKGAPE